MKRHPSKRELMSYAESLVDTQSTVSAKIGSHVAECPACMAETEAMRATLRFMKESEPLDASNELTAQILLAAQNVRRTQRSKQFVVLMETIKRVGYAAGIVLVSAVCIGAALYSASSTDMVQVSALSPAAAPTTSPELIRKTSAEIETLAEAVRFPSKTPPTLSEIEHRRAVNALNADIEAARAALERNPGCARASRIMDTNLQRKAQALKAVYIERSL